VTRTTSSTCSELQLERREIEARLAQVPPKLDLADLRREIAATVRELRQLLDSGEGRRVLKRLLGDKRLRVLPDAERGFRVEGELGWLIGAGSAASGGGCEERGVAGIRLATPEIPPLTLPWSWREAA